MIYDSSPPSFYINLSFGKCPIIIGREGGGYSEEQFGPIIPVLPFDDIERPIHKKDH
jgi:hypothetical protein